MSAESSGGDWVRMRAEDVPATEHCDCRRRFLGIVLSKRTVHLKSLRICGSEIFVRIHQTNVFNTALWKIVRSFFAS